MAEATAILEKQPAAFKNELLFQHGINFNDVPAWQRRGVGLYWESHEKEGYHSQRKEKVIATRRRIKTDSELPIKGEYGRVIRRIIAGGREVGTARQPRASGA